MEIKLTNIFVDDQAAALEFYTKTLKFIKKEDFPVGEFKWLTVVSPEDPEGTELLLEPSNNPAAKQYKDSLLKQGIAAAAFSVNDIEGEFNRLKDLDVQFTVEPTKVSEEASIAVFNDTCGNLIQIYQKH